MKMNNPKLWWTSSSGTLEFQLPVEAVRECFHPGACDSEVRRWQSELNLNLDRKLMIQELSEFGAWELHELEALSNDELEQKVIWIACGDIQHRGETEEN